MLRVKPPALVGVGKVAVPTFDLASEVAEPYEDGYLRTLTPCDSPWRLRSLGKAVVVEYEGVPPFLLLLPTTKIDAMAA